MTPKRAEGYSLEFLSEPAFLVRRGGTVLNANGAARRLLGESPVGGNLFDHVVSPHENLDAYLRRASGSTASIIGAATLRTTTGPVRFRLNCAVVLPEVKDGDGAGLLLRCLSQRDDRFAALERRVRELDDQLRARLREKQVLEDALQENQALLQELQHRVKNNIQLMLALIQMSAPEARTDEAKTMVERARFRLQAMATAQEAIYRSKHVMAIPTSDLLEELVRALGRGYDVAENLEIAIEDAWLPGDLAHSLALIANELTTNAIKHGLPDRDRGKIRVCFGASNGGFQLTVEDQGKGITPDAGSRTSGINLVRALCRQIGGELEIATGKGTQCSVRFPAMPRSQRE